MPGPVRRIYAQYDVRTKKAVQNLKKANRGLDQTKKATQSVSQSMKNLSAGMQTLAGGAVGMRAIGMMKRFSASAIDAYKKQEQAENQVRQGLKSTENAAGLTFEKLKKVASGLQEKSLFGDEEILGGATAQLLTFGNLTEKQFLRTQQAVLDVTARINTLKEGSGDLTSTSIMLGKALNDPVANLGALSRSGIQFSKDTKKLVKALWESGEKARAQKLIFKELEKYYAGSAEAAIGNTGALKLLSEVMGDIHENVGKAIVEIFGPLAKKLKPLVSNFKKFTDTEKGMLALKVALVALGGVMTTVATVAFATMIVGMTQLAITTWSTVLPALAAKITALGGVAAAAWAAIVPMLPFIAIALAVAGVAFIVYKKWDVVRRFFSVTLPNVFWGFIDKIKAIFEKVKWFFVVKIPEVFWAAVDMAKEFGKRWSHALLLALGPLGVLTAALIELQKRFDVIGKAKDLMGTVSGAISGIFGEEKVRTGGTKGVKKVNDLIISDTGQAYETHPDDHIIATKNPGGMGGKGIEIAIGDINISVASAADIPRNLKKQLEPVFRDIAFELKEQMA
jgi:hypothetical protein